MGGQPPQPDMAALQGQFNQMNIQQQQQQHGPQQPYNVTLDGVQPEVVAITASPPTIRLPPRSSVTPSPEAVCAPDYCRSTVNAIPNSSSLAKKIKLPLGLLVTPHKTLAPQEPPVPTVYEITRCRRCRTYINPYVQFMDDGRRWKCNLCYVINDVPHFFDYNANEQRMINRWERPELNCAVVDYIAPSEYMVRPPQPPVFLFVIDVSAPAIQAGVLSAVSSTLLACLDRIPNDDKRAKFGLITVDTSLHFYSLKADDPEPRMLVVSDLDDVFIPQPDDLLVNMDSSKTAIEGLLKKLPDMFKNNHATGNALGPALQAAFKLVSPVGGRIIVLQSSLPTLNEGALKLREESQMLGTSKESALLGPAAQFYKTFAVDCSRVQVCVDMFMFSSQYTDVATLSCLPKFTGGQTYYYPGFHASRREDAEKFEFEFNHYLESEVGLEAVLRLRASRGIRMTAFHGNFFLRSMDLLALPAVTPDHCYGVEFAIEEDITTPSVGFQTAVLHTSCHGERRIRVVTLVLPVVSTVSEVYASADQIALTSLLAKKAVERTISSKLEDAREALNYKCYDIVNTYKTELTASASGAAVHLQLCENLKLLPLFTLALQKHVSLRGGSQVPSDLRSYAMNLLYTMPPELLIPYIYPRLYALHLMPPEVGTINADGVTLMPSPINLSSERLDRGGAFLLDDGQTSMIWLGRDVSPQLLQDLFGVVSYDALRGGKTTLPTVDHDFSRRVKTVLAKLRQEKRNIYYPNLYVVKEDGEPALRLWFLSHLIEDRTGEQPAYPMWLAQIREKVNSGSY
ncbi:COPII component protein [Syncephalis fuscata]|nr:COPII component protein [Syncephalis fuscata]